MVRHTVFWKVRGNGPSKDDNCKQLIEALSRLKEEVPGIVELHVGTNFFDGEAAYDLCLQTVHSSREDLDLYRTHPDHVKVAELVKSLTTDRAYVDMEA